MFINSMAFSDRPVAVLWAYPVVFSLDDLSEGMRVVAKAMRHGRLGLHLHIAIEICHLATFSGASSGCPRRRPRRAIKLPGASGQTIIVSALALPGSCQCRPLNSWSLATMPIPRYKKTSWRTKNDGYRVPHCFFCGLSCNCPAGIRCQRRRGSVGQRIQRHATRPHASHLFGC